MRNSVAPVPSSKVAQMASIFQSSGPSPGSDVHQTSTGGGVVLTPTPSVITNRKPSDISISQPRNTFPSSSIVNNNSEVRRASKVSVHRTESHHERFSSARALFERMGSGDNLLEDSRSRSSVVTSPSGSRTSSVSHRPGSRTDSESGVSSRHSITVRSRSSSPLGQESRSSSVSSTAEYIKNGVNHDYIRNSLSLSQQSSPSKHPPDKPERKINAKEAISKQRNWFSNFEKSKTGPESVDSARRTSVNKENKPSFVSGSVSSEPGSPARSSVTMPLSPNHQTKSISPKTSDSIEAYMQNWKKSPTNSKNELW